MPHPWLVVERKLPAVTFHYRSAPDVSAAAAQVAAIVDATDPDGQMIRFPGRRALELRPPGAPAKGESMRFLLDEHRPAVAFMLGDDRYDARAFEVLRAARAAGRDRRPRAGRCGPPRRAAGRRAPRRPHPCRSRGRGRLLSGLARRLRLPRFRRRADYSSARLTMHAVAQPSVARWSGSRSHRRGPARRGPNRSLDARPTVGMCGRPTTHRRARSPPIQPTHTPADRPRTTDAVAPVRQPRHTFRTRTPRAHTRNPGTGQGDQMQERRPSASRLLAIIAIVALALVTLAPGALARGRGAMGDELHRHARCGPDDAHQPRLRRPPAG